MANQNMPFIAIQDLKYLSKEQSILGLDPGSKNIGIAISDVTKTIASPLKPIRREKFSQTAAKIFAIIDEKNSGAICFGLPLNMDGSSGASAQAARAFARNLMAIKDIPVFLRDERLSTSAVQKQMIEADISRARRAAMVDSAAAAFTLQGVLDELKNI